MTKPLLFVGILVMGRTWICLYVPSWRHGHTKIMPCLQEYGSPPVPLELTSSPELLHYCFPGMAMPKHFFPISWISVASEKNPNKWKTPTTQKTRTPQTKPNETKLNSTKPLKHFCFSAGSVTGNSNNLPFPQYQCMVKEKVAEKGSSWWELKMSFNFSLKQHFICKDGFIFLKIFFTVLDK